MQAQIRRSGIDTLGDIPWGTHFCQMFNSKEDLIDILVPYFRAGLQNNEYCFWVTAPPLDATEAREAMKREMPDFDAHVSRGQIDIIPHTEWYLRDGIYADLTLVFQKGGYRPLPWTYPDYRQGELLELLGGSRRKLFYQLTGRLPRKGGC